MGYRLTVRTTCGQGRQFVAKSAIKMSEILKPGHFPPPHSWRLRFRLTKAAVSDLSNRHLREVNIPALTSSSPPSSILTATIFAPPSSDSSSSCAAMAATMAAFAFFFLAVVVAAAAVFFGAGVLVTLAGLPGLAGLGVVAAAVVVVWMLRSG